MSGELLFDTDLDTRTIETFSFDESTNKFTIRTQQDVTPILESIKEHGKLNVTRDSKARKAVWRHIGQIPNHILADLRRQMRERDLSHDEREQFMKKFLNGEGACWKFDKSYRI